MRERCEKDGRKWIKSDWFCMECGERDVWQDAVGEGWTNAGWDFYTQYAVHCFSCGHIMYNVEQVTDDVHA
jgi:uncharacterized Zn finger protein